MATRSIVLLRWAAGCAALAGLLLPGLPAAAEDDGDNLEASVDVLYRNVSQAGSFRKYNEDFDALGVPAGAAVVSQPPDFASVCRCVRGEPSTDLPRSGGKAVRVGVAPGERRPRHGGGHLRPRPGAPPAR